MSRVRKVINIGDVTDPTGQHRLVLHFVEAGPAFPNAYDFHSLVWYSATRGVWTERAVITSASFQRGNSRRRWVSRVHSVHEDGWSIIQVGEDGPREADGTLYAHYTWREWDISKNREVRMIRECDDPFEPFEGP